MGTAILVEYYDELPESRDDDNRAAKVARLKSLNEFRHRVAARYTEGTLQRLLLSPDFRARRAAALALGLLGTLASNPHLAAALRDEDREVRTIAGNGLWSLWFRADSEENSRTLQRVMRMSNPEKMLAGFDALIAKAPRFAEAYNQRAILHFRLEEYQKSIEDARRVLKLNPYHFGAQSGMGQAYMKLRKPRAALRAFRRAYRMNPELQGVRETIRALEDVLGEGGKKDDKK